jgi:hypothetical protein
VGQKLKCAVSIELQITKHPSGDNKLQTVLGSQAQPRCGAHLFLLPVLIAGLPCRGLLVPSAAPPLQAPSCLLLLLLLLRAVC